MSITTLEGIVENGRIRLREDVSLPENTKVYVIVADGPQCPSVQIRNPRLAHREQFKDFNKKIVEA